MEQKKGLERAAQVSANRLQEGWELKERGSKIAGYLCCYIPVELLAAAGYVPFRILGDMSEPITTADSYLPTVMCPFCRSCLDLAFKGKYDFLNAFFGAHACDGAERVTLVWRSRIDYDCTFYLDVPHTVHRGALNIFRKQIGYMKNVLEKHIGREITDAEIKEQIVLYNRQRELVSQLYHLRKADPTPVSGTEVLQLAVSLMGLPVEEGNRLVEEVLDDVMNRPVSESQSKGRILVWGCLIDNTAITKLIENSGLAVVMDDTAIGSRTFGHRVELTEDPLDGLAERYLDKIVCPRTFRETGKTRAEDLEKRFSYLKRFIHEWRVDGVYMNLIRNCDIHGYEIPELRSYIEDLGLPVLGIEQDYSIAALAPMRTRFQAFAESIE